MMAFHRLAGSVGGIRKGRARNLGAKPRAREKGGGRPLRFSRTRNSLLPFPLSTRLPRRLFIHENLQVRTTEIRFYAPARPSTPHKPFIALKPLDVTTWLRSSLSKVFLHTLTYLLLYCLTNQGELQRFIPAPKVQLARNTCAFRIELNILSTKICQADSTCHPLDTLQT